MPALDVQITIESEGPIFDGRFPRIMDAFIQDVSQDVSRRGVQLVQGFLQLMIRNPTPYYWTQIQTQRQMDDLVVTDGGVIYGPWLEGTGSRNATSRFKGYHAFRRMGQRLQGEVGVIAAHTLARYIRIMNG